MTVDPRFTEEWEHQIKYWLHYFKESGNPLYAWKVVKMAGLMGLPIPEEVTLYLVNVATDIEKVAENPPLPQKRPLELAKALGLHKKDMGAGSAFAQYKNQKKNKEIAQDAYFSLINEPETAEYKVFQELEKKHRVSESKVRDKYKEYMQIWKETADHLLEVEAYAVDENNDVYFRVNILNEDKMEAAIVARMIKERLFGKK